MQLKVLYVNNCMHTILFNNDKKEEREKDTFGHSTKKAEFSPRPYFSLTEPIYMCPAVDQMLSKTPLMRRGTLVPFGG